MENVIQWYPGHMAKAKRMLAENLRLVDVVIELIDARVPLSSRNPDIDSLLGEKPRVIALNKIDLANPELTKIWSRILAGDSSARVVGVNSVNGAGVNDVVNACGMAAQARLSQEARKGRRPRPARVMTVGIPNVGKSSLINRMVNKGSARVGNRPGVTRGPQWVRIRDNIELLDTPGLLWHKFEDQSVGVKLALTGAISQDILNAIQLTEELLKFLYISDPLALVKRYKEIEPDSIKAEFDETGNLSVPDSEVFRNLTGIARSRGYLLQGGQFDIDRASTTLLQEFKDGKLGRFTLDIPPEA